MNKQLYKWKWSIEETRKEYWQVSLTHQLGSTIEKSGYDLNQVKREVEESALIMNSQIENLIKAKRKE